MRCIAVRASFVPSVASGNVNGPATDRSPNVDGNHHEGFRRPLHEAVQEEETGARRHDPHDRGPQNIRQGNHGFRRGWIEPSRERDAGSARDEINHDVQTRRDAGRHQCPLCDAAPLELTIPAYRPQIVGNKRSVHGMPPCSLRHVRARHPQCVAQQAGAQAQGDAVERMARNGAPPANSPRLCQSR